MMVSLVGDELDKETIQNLKTTNQKFPNSFSAEINKIELAKQSLRRQESNMDHLVNEARKNLTSHIRN